MAEPITNETRDRVIRMETELLHVVEKVDGIADRLMSHELNTNKSFEALRENALRLQITSENLLAETRARGVQHAEATDKIHTRVSKLEEWRWYIAGGAVVAFVLVEIALKVIFKS